VFGFASNSIPKRATTLCLAALVVLAHFRAAGVVFRTPLPKVDGWKETGLFLRRNYPDVTIAVDAAGKIPYFSGLPTIDMLGLCDTHIAHLPATKYVAGHSKHDADWVLGKRPDIIASWVATADLDLFWGMTRRKYTRAGYEVAYLVGVKRSASPTEREIEITNVLDCSREDIIAKVQGGHRYALLLRVDRHAARGTPRRGPFTNPHALQEGLHSPPIR
jgi:hypothetical protein